LVNAASKVSRRCPSRLQVCGWRSGVSRDAPDGAGRRLLVRAVARRDAGDLAGAVEDATRALDLVNGDADAEIEAQLVLGSIHQAGGAHAAAATAYERALTLADALPDGDQLAALVELQVPAALGVTYRLLGRYADAERALRRALAVHVACEPADLEAVA